jgi:hypothetical protein
MHQRTIWLRQPMPRRGLNRGLDLGLDFRYKSELETSDNRIRLVTGLPVGRQPLQQAVHLRVPPLAVQHFKIQQGTTIRHLCLFFGSYSPSTVAQCQ